MKRIAGVAVVLGLVLIGAGYAYDAMFAGIPYQDPTPELAARYAYHAEIAGWIGRAGLAVLVAGLGLALVWQGVRRLRGEQDGVNPPRP
jgi:hypothetical protein